MGTFTGSHDKRTLEECDDRIPSQNPHVNEDELSYTGYMHRCKDPPVAMTTVVMTTRRKYKNLKLLFIA